MSNRVLITAPTVDVLSVADCKATLGITSDGQDAMIEASIGAVVATLDPASGGWLGRALRPQTWELRLSGFICNKIELPYPILTSLTSVKYDDSDGAEQTLTVTTDYRVYGQGGHGKAYIVPAYNDYWPTARSDYEAVRIRYVCGYAGTAMPKPITQFIALQVRMLLSNIERNLYLSGEDIPGVRSRRWVVSDSANELIRKAGDNLLSTYRVWG